ncbi:MAG: DUF3253 domain-containing protein [Caulobacteraceae bacterium]|nr:DUF3253 domain-containing protein [Caulobacteraceae bacterium]
MSQPVEDAIFRLLEGKAPGKSISPEEVAKAVEPERWSRLFGHVRTTAINLAREGRIEITRHNKPVDPENFKGVYRLRLPISGDQ